MRTWQVERRKRTRHLIELGGLVVKSGIVDLTGDDRAIILGALLWMADKLKSDQGERARALWAAKGKEAFAVEQATDAPAIARLGACESARGPDTDRHVKLLIQFAVEGSLSGAYSQPLQIDAIILLTFASSRSIAGVVANAGPFMWRPLPDDESAVPSELVPGVPALVP